MKHMIFSAVSLMTLIYLTSAITNTNIGVSRVTVNPKDRSYVGLVVAITSSVEPRDETLILNLQKRISGLSEATYRSIGISIASATILLPATWFRDIDKFENIEVDDAFDKSTETADIVVGDFEEDIRTVHIFPCSYEALRIEINKNLILGGDVDAADFERLLEHHWYHKRYGVFDERPVLASQVLKDFTDKKPYVDAQKFYHANGQTIKPVSCAHTLEFSYNISCNLTDTEVYGYLPMDNVSLPTDCLFKLIEPGEITPSIMSYLSSEKIGGVCDNTTHNFEAPNQQNRLCGNRSVRSVMEGHIDFKDELPKYDPDTRPPPVKFSVEILRSARKIAFVLDVSDSMVKNKLQKPANEMITSMVMNLLEDEAEVMIVTFAKDEKTSILVPLTPLSTTENRKFVVDGLDNIANHGFTCIGCGLQTAYNAVKDSSSIALSEGFYMILLTDGKNNERSDLMEEMFDKSSIENFFIYTILLSQEAEDAALLDLINKTNSRYYRAYNNLNGIATLAAAEVQRGTQSKIHNIFGNSWTMTPGERITDIEFWVEEKLRPQANLTLTWFNINHRNQKIKIWLSHAGNTIGNYTSNATEGSILINLPKVESDSSNPFKLEIFNDASSHAANVSVSLTSRELLVTSTSRRKRSNDNEGRINDITMFVKAEKASTLGPSTKNTTLSPISLHVVVSFEGELTAPSDVLATVLSEPEDRSAESTRQEIRLYDNGVGADIVYGDGVYSAYFTHYSTLSGIYYPQALLKGKTYMRSAVSEPFSVTVESGYTPDFGELFPPSQINDLMPVNVNSNSVTINFTAPGADLDQGTVESYKLYYASNSSDLSDRSSSFTLNHLPKPAGEHERITFNLETQNGTVWLAISAEDIDGKSSQLSNVISVRYIRSGEFEPMPWFIWLILALSTLITIILVVFIYVRVKHKPKAKESHYKNWKDDIERERPLSSTSFGFETLQRDQLYRDDEVIEQNNIYQTHRVHRIVTVNKNSNGNSTSNSEVGAKPVLPTEVNEQSDDFVNDVETGNDLAISMLSGSSPESIQKNI